MVSVDIPQRPPPCATMVTVPAFSVVIIAPPVSVSFAMATIDGSDAPHSRTLLSTPSTTAGTWNVCFPSKAEYIGEKRIFSALFGHVSDAAPLPPPSTPLFPSSGDELDEHAK